MEKSSMPNRKIQDDIEHYLGFSPFGTSVGFGEVRPGNRPNTWRYDIKAFTQKNAGFGIIATVLEQGQNVCKNYTELWYNINPSTIGSKVFICLSLVAIP